MEEQPAYCWKDVGSIPTTSAVGWEGLKWSEKSVAYSNSKLEFSRKGAASQVMSERKCCEKKLKNFFH